MNKKMDVRKEFLEYFKSKNHKVIPSSPLVPEDASLLFANAGMVPFKPIFTGEVPVPNPPRATSSQTCIRAGGKHNDLDNVGYTSRHHTFFEMLGNFSFGDYFKEEAISYGWEFVTQVLEFPKEKLYATVHESDDEAAKIWEKYVKKERIYRFGDKDNFWQMGDTGPCGPCSEIFYDQGEKHFSTSEDYMGGDGDRFLEIWNLVFMQYERNEKGDLNPLPKPSIDTGMGLERVVALKEGKFSNFDSSLFMPLIEHVAKLCKKPYIYESGASYRVISDHIRAVSFLLAQGVSFDREGRGYVLRRILRRALRHGYLLGLKKPFMYELVDTLVDLMSGSYAYLNTQKENIKNQIFLEEERFLATISSGLEFFNEELKQTKQIFSGEVAFKLYDTYGFPLDLTADMLRDKNIKVDESKFDELMNEQKQRAKAAWKGSGDKVATGDFKQILEKFGENEFIGYENLESNSTILALMDENFKIVNELNQKGWVFLDKTPFYPQGGGQCADTGEIESFKVLDTQKFQGLILSLVDGKFSLNQQVKCKISKKRIETAKHHSATHLLHSALRKTLGEHIAQAGSLVEPDRLRFDITHPKPITKDELEKIESLVNENILKAIPRQVELMDIDEAKKSGAIALFGEKYDAKVRVLTFGEFSKELCGGIHVENTAMIGNFYITKESGVSAGVRRIEAVCGLSGLQYSNEIRKSLTKAQSELKNNDLVNGISKLKDENKKLLNEIKNLQKSNSKTLLQEKVNDTILIVDRLDNVDLKMQVDEQKNKFDKVAIMLFSVQNDKVLMVSGVKNASLKAGEWIKKVAPILGGGGGGRDDFASAGGKDVSGLENALEVAKSFAKEALNA